MAYSLRKRRRKITKITKRTKLTKRKYNITRRFKKNRKQYGGISDVFTPKVESLLNRFEFIDDNEKNVLMDKLKKSAWRYNNNPHRQDTLIRQLNHAIIATNSTPDEKKDFINKLFDYWLNL